MSTTDYNRLTAEWEAMLGWHTHLATNPKARMSDYLREHKHCDSKDKSGTGHGSYVRHIQANGKVLGVPEDERIAWIQGKIKEYKDKAKMAVETGVTSGIRVKPGTAHHAKAEVLSPFAAHKAKKDGERDVMGKKALKGLQEAYEALKVRLEAQVEIDKTNKTCMKPVKERLELNTAVLAGAALLVEPYYKAKMEADERKKAKMATEATPEPEPERPAVDEELDDMPALENSPSGSGDEAERSDSE